jgi:RNA polymerase sigma-54 factor
MSANVRLYNEANLSQQLNLAPQLLNWLKVLQMPALELSQMVRTELNMNPALEVAEPEGSDWDEDFGRERSSGEAETEFGESVVGERLESLAEIDSEWREADEPKLANSSYLQEKHDFMMDHLVKGVSLTDELEQAIRLSDMDDEMSIRASTLVGYIDERGYLGVTLAELEESYGLSQQVWLEVLEQFQAVVPAGIGARSLQECMVLQLRAMGEDTALAERIVMHELELLVEEGVEAVATKTGLSLEAVEQAMNQMRMTDPEPGRMYQVRHVEEVNADLEIRLEQGGLRVELCDPYMPSLRLSGFCKRLLEQRQGSKDDLDYIRRKLRDATFLIQGISQRQETMLKVAGQIMRVQRDYLMTKDGELQPLTMNKVAAIIGVHETTVSRAIANKYVRTPRGMVEMRAFFKVGYRCADGSALTPERVKERMLVMIRDEVATSPLTDQQLADSFKKQGLKVARRTIAKYREELEIPSSKERLLRARAAVSYLDCVAV